MQPIIRHDLGGSIIVRPDPCPRGNHLQAIGVAGRCDDILRLTGSEGRTVTVLPLAMGSVIDEVPGVRRIQVLQTGPATLRLRLAPKEDADPGRVWPEVLGIRQSFLNAQGLAKVEIVRADEPPEPSGRSSKFRQVIAAPEP